MATETEAQRAVLIELADEAALLDDQQETLDATRRRLWTLMTQAKNLKVSSYKIAEAVNLSQPRVMQIIKEQDEGPPPKAPRMPTQKSLLEEVTSLRKQLDAAQAQLQETQGDTDDDGALVDLTNSEPSPAEG